MIASKDASGIQGALARRDVECIEQAGWRARQNWDGSITGVGSFTRDQANQWTVAADKCGEKTGFYQPKLDHDQIVALYKQEVSEAQCLGALGLPVSSTPTEATYVATWGTTAQFYAWDASGAAKLEPSKVKDTAKACPPPTWFLDLPGLYFLVDRPVYRLYIEARSSRSAGKGRSK